MSTDFVDRLEDQLRAAAEGQAHGVRRPWSARPLPGAPALRVALAFVLLALLVAAALSWLPAGQDRRPAGPQARGSFVVAPGLSSVAAGAGVVWAADPVRGRLVRIDPREHRVIARVSVGGEARLAIAHGRLWAVAGDLGLGGSAGPVRLLALDPRTGRPRPRVLAPRTPDGAAFVPDGLQVDRGRLWAVGLAGAVRIDTARWVTAEFMPAPEPAGEPRGVVVDGDTLWTLTAGGRLRHSGPDGRRLGPDLPVPAPATQLLGVADGLAHVGVGRAGLAAVDLATGRVRWQATFGDDLGAVRREAGVLWVQHRVGEAGRLVLVDARTGRRLGATALPEANAVGIARVGDELWVAWAGGRVTVVR